MSRRIKLVVAYDGTDFRGWAAQVGQRTVQSTLTEAVRQVSGEEVEIVGASRTDSGAHARGQVCHFDTEVPIEPSKWARILNRLLESDVSIVSSHLASAQFHSRFCAVDRFYRYRISVGDPDPIRARFVHQHWRGLNVELMNQAAVHLVGDHDFRAYTEELDPYVQNTHRTLFKVDVKQTRDEVWVDVVGTAFLRGMMRRISGALLEVGRGKRPIEEVSRLLTKERIGIQLPIVLPAKGLCLMRVRYGRYPADNRRRQQVDD